MREENGGGEEYGARGGGGSGDGVHGSGEGDKGTEGDDEGEEGDEDKPNSRRSSPTVELPAKEDNTEQAQEYNPLIVRRSQRAIKPTKDVDLYLLGAKYGVDLEGSGADSSDQEFAPGAALDGEEGRRRGMRVWL